MKIRLPALKKGTLKNKKKANGRGGVGNGPPANIITFDSIRTLPVDTSWRSKNACSNTPDLSDNEASDEEGHGAATAAVGVCPTSSATETSTMPPQSKETATDDKPTCMDESQPTTTPPVTATVISTATVTPAVTAAATRRTSLPPPPRRSSLKHTSSYSSTTDNSADVSAGSVVGTSRPTLRPQRHHSMSHVTGTSTSADRRGNVSRSASMSHVTKNNISFDQTVSFVTVPRLSDICTQYPQSLFYSKKDFDEMSVLVRKDAERINDVKAKSSKRSTKSSSSTVQDDNALCGIGIEHRLCSPKERFDREAKARAAVVCVLREQGRRRRQLRRHSSPHSSSENLESALARTSISATKEAIIRARERAVHVERHCQVHTDTHRRNSVPPATTGEGPKTERKASWMAYF